MSVRCIAGGKKLLLIGAEKHPVRLSRNRQLASCHQTIETHIGRRKHTLKPSNLTCPHAEIMCFRHRLQYVFQQMIQRLDASSLKDSFRTRLLKRFALVRRNSV